MRMTYSLRRFDHPSRCTNPPICGTQFCNPNLLLLALTIFMALVRLGVAASAAAEAAVDVDRLRCEYLENPLGIDVAQPRLSWNLAATADPAARGASADRLPNPRRQLRRQARRERRRPVGQRPREVRQVDPNPLRRRAARVARRVLLESPRLGPGRQTSLPGASRPIGPWASSSRPTGTPSGSASTATTTP